MAPPPPNATFVATLGRARRRPYSSRRLERSVEVDASFPLELGVGTHFAYIWVGTPPQRQSVIVDTGSTKMAFPCEPCSQCGNFQAQRESGPFSPSKSSTYHVVAKNAEISAQYAEGDGWRAHLVRDKVSMFTTRDLLFEYIIYLIVFSCLGCFGLWCWTLLTR